VDKRIFAATLLAAGLSGCALGPDFKQPAAPAAANDSYTPTPLPSQTASAPGTGGAAQQFAFGQEIPAQWWTLFRSEALDQLIRAALAQNPNMAAAEAALRQAQENYNAQAGSLVYPSVNAQLGVARQKTSVATAGGAAGVFNLYNASVNVAYTPDVFGATRRTLEGAQAAVDYQRFQVEATYLALSANVVTGAIQEASARAAEGHAEVLDALNRQLGVIENSSNMARCRAPRCSASATRWRRWRPRWRRWRRRWRRRSTSCRCWRADCRARRACRSSRLTR
jgi:outer membrane protein TolC